MRDVHHALGDYRCIIDELVTDGDRAAARMRFTGKHRAECLGVAATGRQVTWAGAAFFRFEGGRITELWVFGDVVELRRQNGGAIEAPSDRKSVSRVTTDLSRKVDRRPAKEAAEPPGRRSVPVT